MKQATSRRLLQALVLVAAAPLMAIITPGPLQAQPKGYTGWNAIGNNVSVSFTQVSRDTWTWFFRNDASRKLTSMEYEYTDVDGTHRDAFPGSLDPGKSFGGWTAFTASSKPSRMRILSVSYAGDAADTGSRGGGSGGAAAERQRQLEERAAERQRQAEAEAAERRRAAEAESAALREQFRQQEAQRAAEQAEFQRKLDAQRVADERRLQQQEEAYRRQREQEQRVRDEIAARNAATQRATDAIMSTGQQISDLLTGQIKKNADERAARDAQRREEEEARAVQREQERREYERLEIIRQEEEHLEEERRAEMARLQAERAAAEAEIARQAEAARRQWVSEALVPAQDLIARARAEYDAGRFVEALPLLDEAQRSLNALPAELRVMSEVAGAMDLVASLRSESSQRAVRARAEAAAAVLSRAREALAAGDRALETGEYLTADSAGVAAIEHTRRVPSVWLSATETAEAREAALKLRETARGACLAEREMSQTAEAFRCPGDARAPVRSARPAGSRRS